MEKVEQELVIHHAVESTKQAMALVPIIGTVALFGFVLVKNLFGATVFGILLQFFFGGTSLLFFIVSILGLFYMRTKEPLAIINNNGVWVKHFGLITWPEIRNIGTYRYKNSPLEMIALYLHDSKKTTAQASFRGKIIFFWSKITGVPPITISNTELPYATIIAFAQQFLSEKS